MSRLVVTAVWLVGLLALSGIARPAIAQPADLETRALEYVAQEYGIPVDQLTIGASSQSSFPLTGVSLTDFKVIADSGQSYEVSFDQGSDDVVDWQEAAGQEAAARLDAYATIEPSLFNRIQRNAAERIPVAIWVKSDDLSGLGRGPNADLNALAAEVSQAQAPVVEAGKGIGAQLARADLAPVLFAELNAGQINGLSHHPNVVAIEAIPQDLGRFNDDMATSDRYRYIWSKATGSGAKIAVHEDDGVDTATPLLINPIYWCTGVNAGPGGTACTIGTNVGSHATNVAGVIASTDAWRRGGAFGLTNGSLLSANFQSFGNTVNIVNSATWALGQGADSINMSWGTLCSGGAQDFFSRWADYVVKTFGDSVVASSGNSTCASGTPQYVGAPSLGWNTISVGSYWDTDTGRRSDDVFSSFTSTVNPTDPNSGRTYEKPDVTGMGGQVDGNGCHGSETTAIGGGAQSTCGTSFAAPDVTALTALLVGKNTSLRGATEAVKAIVMAGATHNIVDGANYTNCPSVDCRDGAGAIDANQTISNVLLPGNFRFFPAISGGSFNASGNIDIPVTIGAKKDIQIAIAWDSTAVCSNLGTGSQACTSDVLNADLDLHLIDPNGSLISAASSFQNSAEVINFKTAISGTYIIRVHNFRFDAGTNTFLGVAWNLNTKDSKTPLTGATSVALNTTKSNQTTDKGGSFWDNYLDPAAGDPTGCESFLSFEVGLEKVFTVKTTQTGNLTATLSNIVPLTQSGDLDVAILKKSGKADDQNKQMIACGNTAATASSVPAGAYYVVVDGFAGAVAKFNLAVAFNTSSTNRPQEPLPPRTR